MAGFLVATMVAPTWGASVTTSGGESESSSTSRSGINPTTSGVGGSRNDSQLYAAPAKASESESDWARFRKTLRAFLFDQGDDAANVQQRPTAPRAPPGVVPTITPGAFQVPTMGGTAPDLPAEANDLGRIAARDLARPSGPSGVGFADGFGDANRAGLAGNAPKAGEGAAGAVGTGRGSETRAAIIANAGPGGADGFDLPTMKSRETKLLEGMLVSELIDQVQPWLLGLVALLVFWQLVKGMIHVMQISQERALRRKAERSERSMRKSR